MAALYLIEVSETLLVGFSGCGLALDSAIAGLAAGFSFSLDTSTFVFETLFLISLFGSGCFFTSFVSLVLVYFFVSFFTDLGSTFLGDSSSSTS